jgi:sugar transferase (PEP-CTERM/EpsH1 system associated)
MKPRVLLLAHRVPFPPNRGDRIRCWQLLRSLAEQADVSLAAIADEPVSPATYDQLAQVCEQVFLPRVQCLPRLFRGAMHFARGRSISEGMFYSPALAKTIVAWHSQHPFDATIVYCSSMFPYVATPAWAQTPVFVDLIDVDSQKWTDYADQASFAKRWLYRCEAKAVERLESRIVATADAVALTTPGESAVLEMKFPDARPQVMTNGVDFQYFRPVSGSLPGRIAFVGVLNYWPNVQGMLWFIEHVWQRLRAAVPNATLEIIGREPCRQLLKYDQQQNIRICANVADIRPHLAAAEVAIAPLHIARGIQNKVLEALAMQRAVVASPAVCRGLSARPGEHLLCAASPDEWVADLQRLLTDASERECLANAGRRFVETHHDWVHCLQPLREWLSAHVPASSAPLTPEFVTTSST